VNIDQTGSVANPFHIIPQCIWNSRTPVFSAWSRTICKELLSQKKLKILNWL